MGAPAPYGPMDFAAWFEAYLGGRWYTFDPRNNVPRIGRVLVARGRDAIDVAITTTFGPNTLGRFKVWTDELTSAGPGRRLHHNHHRPVRLPNNRCLPISPQHPIDLRP